MNSISWASPLPDVQKCWSDIASWRSSSVSWWNANVANKTGTAPWTTQTWAYTTVSYPMATTIYPANPSTYRLCDGSARVNARPITSSWTSYETVTVSQTNPVLPGLPSTPPCQPDGAMCRHLYYDTNANVTNQDELLSLCGLPTALYEPCLLAGGPIQLIYFPDTVETADPCPVNASIHTSANMMQVHGNLSAPATPEKVTTLGHTFTSGSVYLSFKTLFATYDGFHDRVGPNFTNYIVPVPSNAVSTRCGPWSDAYDGPATPLTYADLAWPVAASAYSCQARCSYDPRFLSEFNDPAECSTIWSDVDPNIAVPTQVRNLIPEWASCSMEDLRYRNFWFDPPIPLTQVATIAAVTTALTTPTTEPAAPSSTLASSVPTKTGAPQSPESSALASENSPPPSSRSATQAIPADPSTEAHTIAFSEIDPSLTASTSNADSASTTGASSTQTALDPSTAATQLSPMPDPTSADPVNTKPSPSSSANGPSTLEAPSVTAASANALSVLASAMSAQSITQTTMLLSFDPTTLLFTEQGSAVEPETMSPQQSTTASQGSQDQASNDPTVVVVASTGASAAAASQVLLSSVVTSNDASIAFTFGPTVNTAAPSVSIATVPATAAGTAPERVTLAAGSLTLVASQDPDVPGVIVVGGGTLSAGGAAMTTDGAVVSADSSGLVALLPPDTNSAEPGLAARPTVLAAGSVTVSAMAVASDTAAVSIDGTTLSVGGPALTSAAGSVVLSQGPSGLVAIGSGSTDLLSTLLSQQTQTPKGSDGAEVTRSSTVVQSTANHSTSEASSSTEGTASTAYTAKGHASRCDSVWPVIMFCTLSAAVSFVI